MTAKKHEYKWRCNHEHINPVTRQTVTCNEKGTEGFSYAADAASAGLREHSVIHRNDIVVVSTNNTCVGTAIGLNFNTFRS
jgi:hypothetical protein